MLLDLVKKVLGTNWTKALKEDFADYSGETFSLLFANPRFMTPKRLLSSDLAVAHTMAGNYQIW